MITNHKRLVLVLFEDDDAGNDLGVLWVITNLFNYFLLITFCAYRTLIQGGITVGGPNGKKLIRWFPL